MTIAARAAGLDAVDGPFVDFKTIQSTMLNADAL